MAVIGAAVVAMGQPVRRVGHAEVVGVDEIGVVAGRRSRRAPGAARSITRSFQPMCGTFSARSAGSIRTTSPAIQPKPGTSSYSCPRVASICMPTQMPRKGRPCRLHRLDRSPRTARRTVAKRRAAGREGAVAGQHDPVGAGHVLGARGDEDLARRPSPAPCAGRPSRPSGGCPTS